VEPAANKRLEYPHDHPGIRTLTKSNGVEENIVEKSTTVIKDAVFERPRDELQVS
jgi:hypothetical protein